MKLGIEVVNFNFAGIDVGSRSHYVTVGQQLENYRFCHRKIKAYDKEIKRAIKCYTETKELKATEKPHKQINKNAPNIKDINQLS